MSKTLIFNIKAYVAEQKLTRNIDYIRKGILASDSILEQSFTLAQNEVKSITGVASNKVTYLSSNRPVNLVVTSDIGDSVQPFNDMFIEASKL